MNGLSWLSSILGCAVALVLAACAANGNVAPTNVSTTMAQAQGKLPIGPGWIHAGSLVYHIPEYLATRSAVRAVVPSGFPYLGGPVLLNPKVYLIFWGYKKYGDPDKVARLLEEYSKAEGGSGHNNIYTQYYDIVSGQTNYITNPKGQLGGVWFDNTNTVPQNPTDFQIAKEALNGVANLGYDVNGSYVVATPRGRSTQGFGTQWCAYHSATYSGGNLVSYTNLPYIPEAGVSCGAKFSNPPHHPKDESAKDEGVTVIEGAEYGESITDPDPGTGWYASGEISCPWVDIQNDRFGKKSYTVGSMYSNASQSCVQKYK